MMTHAIARVLAWAVLLAAVGTPLAAEPEGPQAAQWIRHAAIHPDGTSIAFAYKGDLWLVPRSGGTARALTTHEATERYPVWSRDGKRLAFASDRHGNFDVFVMPGRGGPATRLTWHGSADLPWDWTADGDAVIATSRREDDAQARIPTEWASELYAFPVAPGRPRQLLTTPAEYARLAPDGRTLVYQDRYGYEDAYRKHHTSSVTRDLRLFDLESGEHRVLTTWEGEDRQPQWSPDGRWIYYLSERSGSFNVWRRAADGSGEPEQISALDTHPVRDLSLAGDGTLCFTWHGELFTQTPGSAPANVAVDVIADDRHNPTRWAELSSGATEIAVAPAGDEVALIVRGEVFVVSVKHRTTRRLTKTVEQERSLSWAPDGKALYYASERGGAWNLYRTRIAGDGAPPFFRATRFVEDAVLVGPDEAMQPRVSPDGSALAYIHNRDEIRHLTLDGGAVRTLVPARRNYSYTDGDIQFRWSPDARYLAFTYLANDRWIDDVGIVSADGDGGLVNMSRSGYWTGAPRWDPAGRILAFATSQYGRRNHGSWGADADVVGVYLTREAWGRSRLGPEDYAFLLEQEEEAAKDEAKRDGDNDPDEDEDSKDGEEDAEGPDVLDPIAIETERAPDWWRRLTRRSAPLADLAVVDDGEAILTLAKVDGDWGLWLTRPRDRVTRPLATFGSEEPSSLEITHDGEAAFVLVDGEIARVSLEGALGKRGGEADVEPVPYRAPMDIDTPGERAHLFEHVWRQAGRKFYDPKLHGVDWDALKAAYASRLPHVVTGYEFAELLSEMLGELNASHTGASYRSPSRSRDTGCLGALFNYEARDEGWLVTAVLEDGPADRPGAVLAEGRVLTHIDGQALTREVRPAQVLARLTGQRIGVRATSADGAEVFTGTMRVVSFGEQQRLLYRRWVKRNQARVEALSDGALGYVHIAGMNDASFRVLYRDAIGRYGNAKGLVVDTRFNGGGWLHDDLVKFFDAREYAWFVPRGKQKGELGSEPAARWARPSVVVMSEGNYSDAHFFPYAYKELGLGKLVGAPVPGTATAVWWERLMDPAFTFGIPQVGMVDPRGNYLENQELQPDVLVLFPPEAMAKGEDPQLDAAVKVLMEELATANDR